MVMEVPICLYWNYESRNKDNILSELANKFSSPTLLMVILLSLMFLVISIIVYVCNLNVPTINLLKQIN